MKSHRSLDSGDDDYKRNDQKNSRALPNEEVRPTETAQEQSLDDTNSLAGTALVNRYEILEVLGRGGMGTVYKCRNRINGKLRAIKVLHQALLADPDAVRRFNLEATAVSRISHANAISVIDVGFATPNQPYLVMEHVQGLSLSELLKRSGPLSLAPAIRVFLQICSALTEAHDKGIVHRDIKPSNIMITDVPGEKFFVKVVDFGIAKVFPNTQDGTVIETSTGEIFGSPPYMSPEQCLGKKLDYRSDIYSLGCLMYEVLSGTPPLVGNNPMGTMYRQLNEMPSPLRVPSEDIRLIQRLDRIISKSLQKDPERRYQTAEELRKDIEEATVQSTKTWYILSVLQSVIDRTNRYVFNVSGSSRRTLIVLLIIATTAIIILVGFLVPTFYIQGPQREQLSLEWKHLPETMYINETLQYKYAHRIKRLTGQLDEYLKDNNSKFSPESMLLRKQIADLYFENQALEMAEAEYHQVITEGLTLFTKRTNYEAAPPYIHDIGLSYLRCSQCALELGHLKAALNFAKAGLHWSFSDDSTDSEYKVFLLQVIAVATMRLTDQTSPQINDYCRKLLLLIDSKRTVATGNYQRAIALSEIADCYLRLGLWEKAIPFLTRAKESWEAFEPKESDITKGRMETWQRTGEAGELDKMTISYILGGKCGPFNSAVASDKIAIAYKNQGDVGNAITYFAQAANELESLKGTNDSDRANVLFQQADALWRHQEYFKALQIKAEAIRIWKANNTNRSRRQNQISTRGLGFKNKIQALTNGIALSSKSL